MPQLRTLGGHTLAISLMAAATLASVHLSYASANPTSEQTMSNNFWWPDRIDLAPLRQHSPESSPMGDFDYAAAFEQLDLDAVKKDITALMTDSQAWWPADYGHYGPFFIRMAWHSAGTYRVADGRGGAGGGQQRFEPLNSWPDNGNLDKARRLLWPVKQKYGRSLSWADLMVLTGNVAMESMGFKTLGFAGGRTDDWEPDLVYWGPEKEMLASDRFHGKRQLAKPLGAAQMGLIYVNPEGPNGVPDPIAAAHDIRQTFGNMAMNDEEIVALIAGGHTFGKGHGAHKPDDCVGPEPAAESIDKQGFGWKNTCGKGHSEDTVTSGLEGAWTSQPAKWTHEYLTHLFNFEWVQTRSPAGAIQWTPKNADQAKFVPDAHIEGKRHAPIMFTADLSLKEDPEFRKISQRFLNDPAAFEQAFAQAWYKLTHRDMGPRARYLGQQVPEQEFAWQDPIPAVEHKLVDDKDVAKLKQSILDSGLGTGELIRTAWASAATYRDTDMRGGANGARVRLAPQRDWPVNNPDELAKVLAKLETVQQQFNDKAKGGKQVSLADVIVLGGNAAVEKLAKAAGYTGSVAFAPGRGDATAEMTDVESVGHLEPKADGFRNYYSADSHLAPVAAMIDKSALLGLTPPEMTALIGGLRVLGANTAGSTHGVFTEQPGTLSNDFFAVLLDMTYEWVPGDEDGVYVGRERASGTPRWTATPVDLMFGSSAELRAIAEVYAERGGQAKFVNDFVAAWVKVMQADRFDLR